MKSLYFSMLFLFISCFSFGQDKEKKSSTATENVAIISRTFLVPELNDQEHKVWVYLPPDYHQTKKRYPVIYMHDGQNLFDKATSYVGEWEVDETLNELYASQGMAFIVVGVENAGAERINEYTPWPNEKYGGGKGGIYMEFIVNTLKPYIDTAYRTKRKTKHTALIGSSLGGLISYYGGLKYPKVFGKIGALSTSFWFSDKVLEFTRNHGNQKNISLYLLVGGKEGESMTAGSQKIKTLLLENGFNSRRLKLKIHPEGKHNEPFWASEFSEIVQWLYTKK